MIILGIDYGDKRVGVAICDPLEIAAHPLDMLERRGGSDDEIISMLKEIVAQKQVEIIVIGLPKNMDGTTGDRANLTLAFARNLRKEMRHVKVETWDERLSSIEAGRSLSARGLTRAQRAERIDTVSAQLILQGYLDARSRKG